MRRSRERKSTIMTEPRRPLFQTAVEPLSTFVGRRVTVMGLGLFGGGRGVTEFLCRHGATVTVTDLRDASILQREIDALRTIETESGNSIRWVLGEHREEDFLGADLVIPSPAVPRAAPLLTACSRRGVPLETEMNLFFKHCRGRICAVTGSNGKTTTASLLASMAVNAWPRTRVGGNLGRSLLPEVEEISPDDWVVLELSSFQLEDLAALSLRPAISAVTNLTANHLDRHGSYESYVEAKRTIVAAGPPPNVAVLNAEDARLRSWANGDRANVLFGRTASVTPNVDGVWIDSETGWMRTTRDGRLEELFRLSELSLAGTFNQLNAAAAAACAMTMGAPREAIARGVSQFEPVRHRLEPVGDNDSILFFNDSVSTTPESTIAALNALGPNVILICGGSDKGCSFAQLGTVAGRMSRAVIAIGETACSILDAVPRRDGGPTLEPAESLAAAVARARQLARAGDRVLLSPACPSYDQFTNFEARGDQFRELVAAG